MILQLISITNFRNIETVKIVPNPGLNLLWGENGSGKTSFLEAIYFLGTGKSFRTRQADRIIRKETNHFVLYSELQRNLCGTAVGIERNRSGDVCVRIDGNNCQRAAELAALLPIQLINPDSYKLIEAGPSRRRQFIDWGLFHVEQSFQTLWGRGQLLLKQRNAVLRQKMARNELSIWSEQLVQVAEKIDVLRQKYFLIFLPIVREILTILQFNYDVVLDYYCGWDKKKEYLQVLDACVDRDYQLGFTQYGFHRADLKMTINGLPVEDLLSRGELKLLVAALSLAQGKALKELTGRACLYLIDDLSSELDEKNSQFFVEMLSKLESQVFITGIDKERLLKTTRDVSVKMFHVEQGEISQQ